MTSKRSFPKEIWIDIDNTPHVPFFAPIVEGLAQRGFPVLLTARDAYQVKELFRLFNMPCRTIGRHYGKYKLLKVAGTLIRASKLAAAVAWSRPGLALSHGSRSQLIAASLLRIPSVMIGDYEFSSWQTGVHPNWVMVPSVIPDAAIPMNKDSILKYPGIKEDVYVPGFRPDPKLRGQLGLKEEDFVVTARPPATEAHYHNPESDVLFHAAIDYLASQSNARIVVLPRNKKQANSVREHWPQLFASGKMIIPEHVVDGLNLLWSSDLAISGGGTMNREAAALGVPVYSVFRGKIGAVDQYLAGKGRLVLLEKAEDVPEKVILSKRVRPASPNNNHFETLQTIIENIVSITESGSPSQFGTEQLASRSFSG
jgi:predicted glycosyltransferase